MENIINKENNINYDLHSNDTSSSQITYYLPIFVYPIQINQEFSNKMKEHDTEKQINQNQILLCSKNSNIYDFINKNYIKSKKEIYRKGSEHQKLSKLPHFNEPYDDLEIFKILGRPDKSRINEIGENYNDHFRKEIKDGLYPKFGRDQKRNKALAVWFFEDCKTHIISWLKESGFSV